MHRAGGAATCGTNGNCDGAGACELYGVATTCAPASCAGTTVVQARHCDGTGTCLAATISACAPQLCAAGACVPCTLDSQCLAGQYCGAGSCLAKKGNGQPASGGNECASGHCADGVCCDVSCDTDGCVACTASYKGSGVDGTCGPVAAGTCPTTSAETRG